MKTQEFLIRVEMPESARWRQNPAQVAFTIRNVVESWIVQSITGTPKVTIQTLPKKIYPRQSRRGQNQPND